MASRVGRRGVLRAETLASIFAVVSMLSACSSGGAKTGATGAAGTTGHGGTTGAAGGGGAGSGGSTGAAGSPSGAAGSGAAGTGAAGTAAAGSVGSTGGAGPTDGGSTDGAAGAGVAGSDAHEAGASSCAHGAISMSANGTGNDPDTAHSHVEIDLMADMPIGDTPRTIEFWFYVKPTDWVAEKNEILFYGSTKGGTRQVIGLDFGQPGVMGMAGNHATLNPWTDGVYDDDSGKYLGITSTMPQWVHVAIVWDQMAFITYVNGVARITTPAPANQGLITLAGLFYVGCLPLNFSCFNGLFDELRVWSVARTADEIMTTYTKAVVGNEPGLVGYWKFDDAPGSTTAADSVTTAGHTAHNGVLMSATDAGAPTFVTPDPPSPVACP
jgi:Concanavalin A-like lectin/glucanases superfamily